MSTTDPEAVQLAGFQNNSIGKPNITNQSLPSGSRLLHHYFGSIGSRDHSAEQVALVLGAIGHLARDGLTGNDIMTIAVLERFKIVPAVWQANGNTMNTSVGEGIVFASLLKTWETRKSGDFTLSSMLPFSSQIQGTVSESIRAITEKGANRTQPYRIYHEGRVLSVIALHYVVCRAELYGETDRIRQSAAELNNSLLRGNIGLRNWFQIIVDTQKDTGFGMTSVMYPRIRVFANSGKMSPREVIEAYDTLFGLDYVYFLGIRKSSRDASSPF